MIHGRKPRRRSRRSGGGASRWTCDGQRGRPLSLRRPSVEAEAKSRRPTLRILTASGAAEASFPLLAPLGREGRFQGLAADDAIYLLMPDRFANGDPGNDDPVKSRGSSTARSRAPTTAATSRA